MKAKVGVKVLIADDNHYGHKAVIKRIETFTGYPGKPEGFKVKLYHLKCECGSGLGRTLKQLRQR